jgi:hypothetical protein
MKKLRKSTKIHSWDIQQPIRVFNLLVNELNLGRYHYNNVLGLVFSGISLSTDKYNRIHTSDSIHNNFFDIYNL